MCKVKETVLKYSGSKWRSAEWIISSFPAGYEKMTYLEPFFGSGAVFFQKQRSTIETINDIDDNIVNLFKVIREYPEEFSKQIELTPWARSEYRESYSIEDCKGAGKKDRLERARRFMVRMWQAIGGKTSDITGWSNNIKPDYTGKAKWGRLTPLILETAYRLKNEGNNIVQIECMNAFDLIRRYDRSETLLYCDPPYLLSTRNNNRIYKNEMDEEQHIKLLKLLTEFKGKVILSGYKSEMYESYLSHWYTDSRKSNCEMGKSATETIWMNYEPPSEQLSMEF